MTTIAPLQTVPYQAGDALAERDFDAVRREMVLDCCKWDPQVADVATLARFPLLMPRSEWRCLAKYAEALSREALAAERELIARPELHAQLGLPRKLRSALWTVRSHSHVPRVMRFDFHFTRDGGWQISECNADVPGGFSEASSLTHLMSYCYSGTRTAGDPGGAWADAVASLGSHIALICAPGFMEDHQVIQYLAKRLRRRDVDARCAQPAQLEWTNQRA